MPYKSERQQLVKELETHIVLLDNDGEDDEAEDLHLLYLHVLDS